MNGIVAMLGKRPTPPFGKSSSDHVVFKRQKNVQWKAATLATIYVLCYDLCQVWANLSMQIGM